MGSVMWKRFVTSAEVSGAIFILALAIGGGVLLGTGFSDGKYTAAKEKLALQENATKEIISENAKLRTSNIVYDMDLKECRAELASLRSINTKQSQMLQRTLKLLRAKGEDVEAEETEEIVKPRRGAILGGPKLDKSDEF